MNVKIDTKEKFHEVSLQEEHFTANMTDDFGQMLSDLLKTAPGNVVLSMKQVCSTDEKAANALAGWQHRFYENNRSFVVCELQLGVEEALDKLELLEVMNVTPTLSEAWDIVQMEEIERELMDGFEEE
jgi:anti-anti-sigma regulatory factor